MRKKDELTDPESCLSKAGFEEPLFVLRATDKLSPLLVRIWVDLARMHGAPTEKLLEAAQIAEAMELWPARKFPD